MTLVYSDLGTNAESLSSPVQHSEGMFYGTGKKGKVSRYPRRVEELQLKGPIAVLAWAPRGQSRRGIDYRALQAMFYSSFLSKKIPVGLSQVEISCDIHLPSRFLCTDSLSYLCYFITHNSS